MILRSGCSASEEIKEVGGQIDRKVELSFYIKEVPFIST